MESDRTRIRSPLFWIVVGLLLVCSLPVSSAAASGAETDSPLSGELDLSEHNESAGDERIATSSFDPESGLQAAQSAGSDLELDQELRRVPDQKGIFEARHRYTLPSALTLLEVTIPADATVVAREGFVPTADPGTHRWDGTTSSPELVYRVPGNRSIDRTGPIAGPGRLIYADVGEWAVVAQPSTGHRWGWTGSERVSFDRQVSARKGAVGDVMAYLGPYDEFTHQAHGQQFRLVVPDRAELAEDPSALFASLESASDTLRVGDRDEEVFMIATPSRRIDWGVRGLQTGPADLWTRDIERLASADSVWLHEYVHTRQGYESASDLRWFTEASATYYAALLALEQDHITFDQFRDRLAVGADERRFRGLILADPGTWQSGADYHVGALVSGELDRRLRTASDREFSLQEVFRRLNAKDDVATAGTFRQFVRDAGGSDLATESDRLTETTDRPSMWDATTHQLAFGEPPAPARITYAFADDGETFAVSGQYRTRPLDQTTPLVLVPGESLTLGVTATNHGGSPGGFEAILRVNDERMDTRTGSLEAGESRSLQFTHLFDTPGEYVLSVGDVTAPVSVRDPATGTVDSFVTNRSELTMGETVRLTANVSNDADRPAMTSLSVRQNGERVDAVSIPLDVGERRTLSFDRRLDEPGTYVFDLENQPATVRTVTVSAPASPEEPTDDQHRSDGAGDGDDPGPGDENPDGGDGGDSDAGDGSGTDRDGSDGDDGGDDSDTPDDDVDESADVLGPGFGVPAALVGLFLVAARLRSSPRS